MLYVSVVEVLLIKTLSPSSRDFRDGVGEFAGEKEQCSTGIDTERRFVSAVGDEDDASVVSLVVVVTVSVLPSVGEEGVIIIFFLTTVGEAGVIECLFVVVVVVVFFVVVDTDSRLSLVFPLVGDTGDVMNSC